MSPGKEGFVFETLANIGVIADTHGLLRPQAADALRGSELILHAGDIDTEDILVSLREIAPLVVVRGNNDYGRWANELPMTQDLRIGSTHIHMLHILADLAIDPAAAGVGMVIYGHSHKPDLTERNGVTYFNPGSAGPRRFKLPITLGRIQVRGGRLEPELIEIAP